MNIFELSIKHYHWVDSMNWHNKTNLESLALIGSEIGEASYEILNKSNKIGEELSDILLRSFDLLLVNNVDFKNIYEISINWTQVNIQSKMLEVFFEFGQLVNLARKPISVEFNNQLIYLCKMIIDIFNFLNLNLISELELKINKNLANGTRGRVI